ncbi:MAG: helix-turn-helix domain-containing protein [Sphingobacteriales bacterium]|jgi:transcriptional regulator with XRE-family HTH domain|nr:helix-turn-helix domain-containing protein [Sphingobacteriales bacterium]MBP9141701.1 helix-turn-helix domain-containing protein [Chitinophagales bacterium]MDA0198496.1 helix-turn-helix domain-containing protein [Bacteroidota bacterium]MBK6888597.1 helix-turn-helix domain-containing protein [Sphingobacteriales bacterium]MBK7528895.1 helix-turn-helix domain-containing protein [Sphingobacteriales bacterium]
MSIILLYLDSNLTYLRKKNGFSQDKVGDAIGVNRYIISNIENGRSQPSIQQLLLLSKLFKISIDQLLTQDISKTDQTPLAISLVTLPTEKLRINTEEEIRLRNAVNDYKTQIATLTEQIANLTQENTQLKEQLLAVQNKLIKFIDP